MILRLFFIFKISSISGVNSSPLQLTLNISSAELIWLINGQSDKQFLACPFAK